MRARRQIVDPITGSRVAPDSPVAVDTGQRIVGRGTVVDDEELDPSRDRFGIDPDAVSNIRARERAEKKARDARKPKGRGPAIPTTMTSPEAGVRQFLGMNPELVHASGEPDVASDTREFMDSIEVRSGKKHVKLNKSPTGQRILGDGSQSESVAVRMLKFLFGQAASRRWRDVPWGSVLNYTGTIAPDAPIQVPVAAGLAPPDETLVRVRAEYGEEAAQKFARKLNSDELTSLADRLERAIEDKGEECLTTEATRAARERLRTLRRWARRPESVPSWSCAGTRESEGGYCTFPAILEDIQRLEGSCERDYDPRWPIKRAEKACEDGEGGDEIGIVGQPCAIERQAKMAPQPKYVIRYGRLVKV